MSLLSQNSQQNLICLGLFSYFRKTNSLTRRKEILFAEAYENKELSFCPHQVPPDTRKWSAGPPPDRCFIQRHVSVRIDFPVRIIRRKNIGE